MTLKISSLVLLCLWELQSAFLMMVVSTLWWFCSSQAELDPPGGVIYSCLRERRRVLELQKCSWSGWRFSEALSEQ